MVQNDSELSVFIAEAVNIKSAGRWDALNEIIAQLAANPGQDNAWLVQVLGALCGSVCSEFLRLECSYKEEKGGSSTVAWRARNLLELAMWAEYCSRSRENARRFYEDAGRDVLGILSAFEKWGVATQQSGDWLQGGAEVKQKLLERADAEGIATLDGAYTAVHEAAKESGFGEQFRASYKVLSKFAHPTAMQILAPPNDGKDVQQRYVFFSKGCLFFTGAFAALERSLSELRRGEM